MYVEAGKIRKPIGILMIEHRLIERALNALEQKAASTDPPDVIAFAELIDFFGTYADATHHGKEEDIMFAVADHLNLAPELVRVLAELRQDHVRFRGYRKIMAAANRRLARGDQGSLEELVATAREFVPRLREHIKKEDKVFFKGFDELQSDRDREAMKKQFLAFDAERLHETYQRVVKRNE